MSRLIFVLISFLSSISYAAEVTDLYQSRTPIANQSEEERQKATARILQQVLVKVVGSPSTLANKDLSPLLAQGEQLVSHYTYQRDLAKGGDSRQQLVLTFNESALNQAISDTGLPIWGKLRPDILVWLVVNDKNKQSISGSEDEGKPLFQLIKRTAEQRGLPVFLPLMDVQDQHELRFINTTKILSDDNALMQASHRYRADIVLLARVIKKDDNVTVDWQWLKKGQLQHYRSKGSITVAFANGINQIADILASEFAIVDQKATKRDYQLVVSDINNFTDYSRVQSYLQGMGVVSNINIISLREKRLDLKLRLVSGLAAFNQVINNDGLLIQENQQQNANIIHYRLHP